jgi:putative addiction module component (TIGR02574 family)
MQTLSEIEREAMKLPDSDRACLASRLLDSLPAVLSDDDDGLAEAIRRSAEIDRDPAAVMTLENVRRTGKLL